MSDFILPTKFSIGGKDYHINWTDWDARELKTIGFDIYNIDSDEESRRAICFSSPLLADVLVYVCQPEDEKAFRKLLDPTALEAGREAVRNALTNFFPPQIRQTVLQMFSDVSASLGADQAQEAINELTELSARQDSIVQDTVTAKS